MNKITGAAKKQQFFLNYWIKNVTAPRDIAKLFNNAFVPIIENFPLFDERCFLPSK